MTAKQASGSALVSHQGRQGHVDTARHGRTGRAGRRRLRGRLGRGPTSANARPAPSVPYPARSARVCELSYNFDESTATRTGGALATDGIEVPGQPRELRLWVNSSGHGEWASLQAFDGTGALLPAFRAGFLTSTGWQQLSFPVPPGTQYPLRIRRYYSAETKPEAQYKSEHRHRRADRTGAAVDRRPEAADRHRPAGRAGRRRGQGAVAVRGDVGRAVRRPRPRQRPGEERPPYAAGDPRRAPGLPAHQRRPRGRGVAGGLRPRPADPRRGTGRHGAPWGDDPHTPAPLLLRAR